VTAAPSWSDQPQFSDRREEERERNRQSWSNGATGGGPPPPSAAWASPETLTLAYWLERELAPPDFLFGEVISTTSRVMVVGPTGLGKTHLCLAIGVAVASGKDFLHWRVPAPRRVLYIDGEMSRRLLRARLQDAVRRADCPASANLFVVSREDCPDMPPLNTEAGQKFVDEIILVTQPDLIFFDNVQCLVAGDMKDEEAWAQLIPWIRDLTRREIGQVWAHHTGHDETHAYGTKTREWQLDAVALMERADLPVIDIAFILSFPKARERTPDNRTDFDPALITLAGDQWTSNRGGTIKPKPRSRDLALDVLIEEIARGNGEIPPAAERIPRDTLCLEATLWRLSFEARAIAASPEAAKKQFLRSAKELLTSGRVGKFNKWVWPVKQDGNS
jgi:hypothetical protein